MAEYPQPGGQQRSQQKFLIFDNFQKMNTQAARTGLPDNQLAWLENLQPLSENKLQVVPAAAAAAFSSIPETINLGFYAFLNGHDYAILFTTAGSAWFIDFTSNAIGQIAPDNTFSQAPDCTVWQGEVLLINDIQAGYSVWNTQCYVQPGGVSPNLVIADGGSGWGAPPLVQIWNDTQGIYVPGAVAKADLTDGVITKLTLINGGSGVNVGDYVYPFPIAGAGSGATFTVSMTSSNLQSVQVSNAGYFASPGAGTYALVIGSGTATATATVSPYPGYPGFFYVSSVTVGVHGSYAAPPPPTVQWNTSSFPITGAGAVTPTFHAMMANVGISSITVSTGGTGYPVSSTLPLSFAPPGGPTPAAAHVNTNVSGVVTGAVTVTSPGSYPFGPHPPTAMIASATYTTIGSYYCAAWPTVPAGTTLAVFQGRVWLGGGNLLQWTGTGANVGFPNGLTPTPSGVAGPGYDDFQAIDASGSLQIVDADLVHEITALRSLNNYLWIMGDQSVKQIGNISLTATNPPITNFTLLTLSSDQGTVWPQSCISYNRIFLFANPNGIFGVFGSTVQKVSDDLDGIFQKAVFTQQPQGALLDLNTKHNAVFLLRYNDPVAGVRSLLLLFDGKKWWLANQGSGITTVLTFPQPTPNLNTLWGTLTGSDLTQLFARPDIAVPFKMQTALSHGQNPVQGKRAVRAGFTADAGATGTVNIEMDGDTTTSSNTLGVTGTSLLTGGSNDANNAPITIAGVYLGMTITGTMANFVLQNCICEYQETSLWKGA